MRPSFRWSAVVVVASAWCFAQPFTGVWAGPGGQVRLDQVGARVRGAVTVEAFGGRVRGTVGDDAQVHGTYVASGGEGAFVASVEGDLLTVRFDDGAPVTLKRVEGARRRLLALAPTPRTTASRGSPTKVPKAAVFRARDDGWALQVPPGWSRRVEGATVVLRSPTEPGSIVASFRAEATAEEFQRAAKDGFVNDGRFLSPRGPPEPLAAKGGTAHAVDLETTAGDGSALYARAASVVGAQGGVLLIGLSPPSQYGAVRARVDQSAQSITFSSPLLPPGRLRGALCSDVGGTVAAWTQRYTFDGRGHLSNATEASSPRRPLPWVEDVGTYLVLGDEVSIRFGEAVVSCRITERHDDGQVTGLRCGERVFEAALCP